MPNQFSFPRSSVQGNGGQRLRQKFVEAQKFRASRMLASVFQMNKLR